MSLSERYVDNFTIEPEVIDKTKQEISNYFFIGQYNQVLKYLNIYST